MYNLIKEATNKELLDFTSPLTKAIRKIGKIFIISHFNQSEH